MSRPLHVLHVITSLSKSQGGPAVALPLLARALVNTGAEVTIVTTNDDGRGKSLAVPLGKPIRGEEGATYLYFPKQTEFYRFSWGLTRWLWTHVRDYDVVHIHALFTYTSTAAGWIARLRGVPYVVRPLGVLNHWGMENRRRRLKRWSTRLVELPILRGAACIHYTSRQEQDEAASAGAGKLPSTIIPLGIDTASYRHLPEPEVFYARFPEARGRRIILFLSRIDAKKGLDLLLPAFAKTLGAHPDALLVVAGDGDPTFVAAIRAEADRLGLGSGKVLWTGFIAGEDKKAALAAATIFVLPSYSENFGIAAAEALAAGLPSVLSNQVALAVDAAETEAALVINCEVPPLVEALHKLLTDETLRQRLSRNASRMATERFSLDAAGKSLRKLYRSVKLQDVAGGVPAP